MKLKAVLTKGIVFMAALGLGLSFFPSVSWSEEESQPPPGAIAPEEALARGIDWATALGFPTRGEGEVGVRLNPNRLGGRTWQVWGAPGVWAGDWWVDLDVITGELRRAHNLLVGSRPPLIVEAPSISVREATELAEAWARLVGIPEDARLVQGEVMEFGNVSVRWVIRWRRFAGAAVYRDDSLTVVLRPDTGELIGLSKSWRTPPPPPVDINVSRANAVPLAKAYLVLMLGKSIGELRDVQLMVVTPPKEPLQGYGHCGEPSRIAWVVQFTRPIGGHFDEASVDAEDGTLVGTGGCL